MNKLNIQNIISQIKNGKFPIKKIENVLLAKGNAQDGAMYNKTLFRFGASGKGFAVTEDNFADFKEFTLDKTDIVCPHSNAVFFTGEKAKKNDEFPVLYTNLYNNYKNERDRREGQLLAYRLYREENKIKTTLLQVVKIGFTNNTEKWVSQNLEDVRPYGNFAFDEKTNSLYSFTMRDEKKETRFFEFKMPSVYDGKVNKFGIREVVLNESDIIREFSLPYFNYIQGADVVDGVLISCEGFDSDLINRPKIRFIDLIKGEIVAEIDLMSFGVNKEPELIVHTDYELYYSDFYGNLYRFME